MQTRRRKRSSTERVAVIQELNGDAEIVNTGRPTVRNSVAKFALSWFHALTSLAPAAHI